MRDKETIVANATVAWLLSRHEGSVSTKILDIKDCSSDLTRDDVLADLSDVTVVRARLAQRWTAMLLGNNLRRVSGRLGSDLKGKMELLQRVKTDNANFDD